MQAPPLARQPEEPARLDGSQHHGQVCYECGASSRDVHMHTIIRWNTTTGTADYLWACADIGPCSMRKHAMGLKTVEAS